MPPSSTESAATSRTEMQSASPGVRIADGTGRGTVPGCGTATDRRRRAWWRRIREPGAAFRSGRSIRSKPLRPGACRRCRGKRFGNGAGSRAERNLRGSLRSSGTCKTGTASLPFLRSCGPARVRRGRLVRSGIPRDVARGRRAPAGPDSGPGDTNRRFPSFRELCAARRGNRFGRERVPFPSRAVEPLHGESGAVPRRVAGHALPSGGNPPRRLRLPRLEADRNGRDSRPAFP